MPRRLSKQHRAKIARGLRRYHKAERQAAIRRSRAAVRGWLTRRGQKELKTLERARKAVRVRRVRVPAVPAVPAAPPGALPAARAAEREEWEVTLHYQNAEGKIVDLTVRMVARTAVAHTNAEVRAACWYAVLHGPEALRDWDVHAVDWRNTRPSGKVEDYSYAQGTPSGPGEAFENAVGLFKTVGMGKLRVALVEQ